MSEQKQEIVAEKEKLISEVMETAADNLFEVVGVAKTLKNLIEKLYDDSLIERCPGMIALARLIETETSKLHDEMWNWIDATQEKEEGAE